MAVTNQTTQNNHGSYFFREIRKPVVAEIQTPQIGQIPYIRQMMEFALRQIEMLQDWQVGDQLSRYVAQPISRQTEFMQGLTQRRSTQVLDGNIRRCQAQIIQNELLAKGKSDGFTLIQQQIDFSTFQIAGGIVTTGCIGRSSPDTANTGSPSCTATGFHPCWKNQGRRFSQQDTSIGWFSKQK